MTELQLSHKKIQIGKHAEHSVRNNTSEVSKNLCEPALPKIYPGDYRSMGVYFPQGMFCLIRLI